MDSLKINQFLDHLILERRLSEHTHRNYRGSLLRFQEWLGKEISGSSLLSTNKEIARSYLIEIQSNLSRKDLGQSCIGSPEFLSILPGSWMDEFKPFQELVCSQTRKDTPQIFDGIAGQSFNGVANACAHGHKRSRFFIDQRSHHPRTTLWFRTARF